MKNKKSKPYDYLLVGAGLFCSTFAYMAKQWGKRCLIIDKRPHLGGNTFCENVEGISVHKYGPHIFHTNNKRVWDFVNSFTPFNQFTLNMIAICDGRIYNLPFNMHTFHQMWGVITPAEAKEKIEEQQKEIVTKNPQNLEEQAIGSVGRDIYELLIKNYTEKQWGKPCVELPASIIKRLPIRFTYDNNYFNDRYQGIPEGGYNKLTEGLLQGIEFKTNCDYLSNRSYLDNLASTIIYSGPIDEYFNYTLGRLEYRSLVFEHTLIKTNNYQGNAIVNYPMKDVPFTRIIEHKHFDINNKTTILSPYTVITREYPQDSMKGQPYYPINDADNTQLYHEYSLLAQQKRNIIFGGRLGTYQYLNMDQVVESSLALCNKLFTGTSNHNYMI